jgi:hypothetical protein
MEIKIVLSVQRPNSMPGKVQAFEKLSSAIRRGMIVGGKRIAS